MGEPGGLERGGDSVDRNRVPVPDEKGNYFIRVGSKPRGDIRKVGLGGPRIEKATGSVAVVDGVVDEAGLSLKHADAIVKLGRYTVILVAGGILGEGERTVVGTDVGYVAVGPGTELGGAITGLARWN